MAALFAWLTTTAPRSAAIGCVGPWHGIRRWRWRPVRRPRYEGKPASRCFGAQAAYPRNWPSFPVRQVIRGVLVPLVFVPRDVAHVSLPCIAVAFLWLMGRALSSG